VPYVFVAPQRRGALGDLAREIVHTRYRGLKGHRSPTLRLLTRLLGSESPAHGELLSYLFFGPEFLQELITMGQRDARRAPRARRGTRRGRSLAGGAAPGAHQRPRRARTAANRINLSLTR